MRIGISTFGCDSGRSGVGQYLQQMLEQLAELAPQHALHLMGAAPDLRTFETPTATTHTVPAALTGAMANLAWHQGVLPVQAVRHRLDMLFLPAANRRLPFWSPCPTVGTVHDLSPLRVPHKYDRLHQVWQRHFLPVLVRRLSHVITVSESSRNDIVELAGVAPSRVTVIPNGVDTTRMQPLERSAALWLLRDLLPDDRPYLLYVSRVEHPGKNHIRLIEAFAHLRRDHQIPHRLVLAGPLCERADTVLAAARASTANAHILFTGFVADEDLRPLYAGADVLVYPSLYEGFGIPVIEAMACGTPVACARASSLPEVGGDAALYFDPLDVRDMAATVARLLRDTSLRRALAEAGRVRSLRFSWRESGRRLLEVLENVARPSRGGVEAPQELPGETGNPSHPCPSSESPRHRTMRPPPRA